MSSCSQLEQLAGMTVLSIDSGDLQVIERYAKTGHITDATTNPLFVSQAGLSGDPVYAKLVDDAVAFAVERSDGASSDTTTITALAIDKLAVNLGAAIAGIVRGYVSTEVDPRLSFDTDASVSRALRIIELYRDMGVDKSRVLIKLAATWEGILAAEILEQEHGITCNLTLIFSVTQAVACAQRSATLISPFPGRILDWNRSAQGRTTGVAPEDDEGVVAVKRMYQYYKCHDHDTICMPASWRPSRGTDDPDFQLDEIRGLAGVDRMTIPAPLLERLNTCFDELPRVLTVEAAKATDEPQIAGGRMDEGTFRYLLNMDGCGTDKLGEGIRAFIGETEKLEKAILEKVRAAM